MYRIQILAQEEDEITDFGTVFYKSGERYR